MTAGYAATRYDGVRLAVGMRPLAAPAARQQGQLPLAKEYIYAGGRLVATEEPQPAPTPTPAGPAPTNLVATATFPTASTVAVDVIWGAPASGSPVSYVIERKEAGGNFHVVGQSVVAPGTTFHDTSASEGAAYLYRVSAVYGGGPSGYSNADLVTAVAFTDSQLQGAVIRADHLKELRRAVAAVRALAGLGAPAWTYPDPVSAPSSARRAVYLEDVTDLRSQLDPALHALDEGVGVEVFFKSYPETPALSRLGTVYAAHFEQIRDRVK